MSTLIGLTDEDEYKLKSLVPPNFTIITSAVARLYRGDNGRWNKISSGIAVVEADKYSDRVYISIYSMTKNNKDFSTDMYYEMCYTKSQPQFHTFSADGLSFGLSFACSMESQKFHAFIYGYLCTNSQNGNLPQKVRKSKTDKLAKVGQIFKKKKGKVEDPVIVINSFQHTQHVGLTGIGEFQVSAENEQMAKELAEALHFKINSKEDMQDVLSVINRYGVNNVRQAMENRKRRAAPLPPGAAPANVRGMPPPPPPPGVPPPPPPVQPSGRGQLLDSIVNFDANKLNKVSAVARKESSGDLMDSIGSALREMLKNRRGHLSQSEDEDDF